MISFYTAIKPYISDDTCGDFYVLMETEDYFFWAVGDIGGHGSDIVGELSRHAQKLIKENYTSALGDIITIVHKDPSFRDVGIVLFLSRVYKKTPILEYMGIGNIRVLLYHQERFKELHMQDGIIGYVIPSKINTNLLKLHKSDQVLVATDGVSLHVSNIRELFAQENSIEYISEKIVERFSHPDDSLCSMMKYPCSNTHFFSSKDLYKKEIL